MSREVTGHEAVRLTGHDTPATLQVLALDEPGAGGANLVYAIRKADEEADGEFAVCELHFQNGAIERAAAPPDHDRNINGITNEALAIIIIDRLRAFQAGPFACKENDLALLKFEEGLSWLHHRTRERIKREVEGKAQK